MDYIHNFENYCDLIIKSKKVIIPDSSLPFAIRRREFEDNCHSMASTLAEIILTEGNNLKDQAFAKGQVIPLNILEEFVRIGKEKINAFLQEQKDNFIL